MLCVSSRLAHVQKQKSVLWFSGPMYFDLYPSIVVQESRRNAPTTAKTKVVTHCPDLDNLPAEVADGRAVGEADGWPVAEAIGCSVGEMDGRVDGVEEGANVF